VNHQNPCCNGPNQIGDQERCGGIKERSYRIAFAMNGNFKNPGDYIFYPPAQEKISSPGWYGTIGTGSIPMRTPGLRGIHP
jgi:hypothetical protein